MRSPTPGPRCVAARLFTRAVVLDSSTSKMPLMPLIETLGLCLYPLQGVQG